MFFFILILVIIGTSLVNGSNSTSCTPTPMQKNTSAILVNLRREMQNVGIGIYVIFSDDEHGSEYTQPYDERREWVTGFLGSAGIAIVSSQTAALWTDSRYFTEAEEELDCANWLLMRDGQPGVPSLLNWLVTEANQTSLVTYPRNHHNIYSILCLFFLATRCYNCVCNCILVGVSQ